MIFEFKDITLEDKLKITNIYNTYQSRSCDNCFANNFLWSKSKNLKLCYFKNSIFYKNDQVDNVYTFPVGDDNEIKEIIDLIISDCENFNEIKFVNVKQEGIDFLKKNYGNRIVVNEIRGRQDYVYLTDKLINLSGKKLHSKRNHINKFLKLYDNYSFEIIDSNNINDCFDMLHKWKITNEIDQDAEKLVELNIAYDTIKYYFDLDLEGGLLRVDNEVIAFAIGEMICDDTFCTHIEKALTDYEGSYTMINQLVARNIVQDRAVYINREEDVDSLGLRKAKMSYYPDLMVNKDEVILKIN